LLRIELLEEYPNDQADLSPVQQNQHRKLPSGFILLATKDRDPSGSCPSRRPDPSAR
jgi:hypothetical protein